MKTQTVDFKEGETASKNSWYEIGREATKKRADEAVKEPIGKKLERIREHPYPGTEQVIVDYERFTEWLYDHGIRFLSQDPRLKACFIDLRELGVDSGETGQASKASEALAKLEEMSASLLDSLDISEQDKDKIRSRGYVLRKEIGENEGATRRAYHARKQVGNLDLEGVLKIPKREEDITSTNAQINRQKRNIDLQEALISGRLRHSGIARVLDSFQLSDGRTCNYEDKIDGLSLTSFLKKAGPIKDVSRLRQIFTPVIEALAYCHKGDFAGEEKRALWGNGILHRDITPNNIIIPESKDTGAVITDWQNAAFENDIENLAVPTRGGTTYTHPVLLNSLVSGNLARATRRMDIYSLGATLYQALTGEKAFHYSVVEDSKGREVKVGDKTFRLSLIDGGETIQEITTERHEDNLKRAKKVMKQKGVSKKLIELVSDMLTTDRKREIDYMVLVQKRFEEATDTTKQELKRNIGNYIRTALITGAVCAGLGFAAYMGSYVSKLPPSPRNPSLSDILRTQNQFRSFSTGNYSDAAELSLGGSARDDFQKYVNDAEKRKEAIDGKEFSDQLEIIANRSSIRVDKRLVSSLIRSLILEDDKTEIAGTNRFSYSLLPKEYVKFWLGKDFPFDEKEESKPERQLMWMGRYIQGMFSIGDGIEDVYLKSLCTREEIELAKANAMRNYMMKNLRDKGFVGIGGNLVPMGEIASASNITNIEYFAREGTERRRILRKDVDVEIVVPGYADNIDPVKRKIIDRAVALYTITDEEGKLDFQRYKAPYVDPRAKTVKGEEAK